MKEIKQTKKTLLPFEKLFIGKSYIDNDGHQAFGVFHRDTVFGLKQVESEHLPPCVSLSDQKNVYSEMEIFNKEAQHGAHQYIQIGALINNNNIESELIREHITNLIDSEFNGDYDTFDEELIQHQVEQILKAMPYYYTDNCKDLTPRDIEELTDKKLDILATLVMAVQSFESKYDFKFYELIPGTKFMNMLRVAYFFTCKDCEGYYDEDDCDCLRLKIYVRFQDKKLLKQFIKFLRQHFVDVKKTKKVKIDKSDRPHTQGIIEAFSPLRRKIILAKSEPEEDFEWEE